MREVLMCACGRFEEAGSDTRLCGLVVVSCQRRANQRSCAGRRSPPPATPCFLLSLCSPCFVGFAAFWSGPCGLYRDHLLHLMGFIQATPGPFASHLPGACLTLGLRLAGGFRRAGGSFRRAGCFYPSLPDTVQNSITIGFCGSRLLWGRLALTCGSVQARR